MLSTEMASKLRSFLINAFMFYNHPQIHRIPRRSREAAASLRFVRGSSGAFDAKNISMPDLG